MASFAKLHLMQKPFAAYKNRTMPLIEVPKVTETTNSSEISLAEKVIDRFGGMAAMERLTPFTYSQIRSFKRTGNIPERDRPVILRSAQESKVDVTPWIFIEHLVDLR